LIVVIVASTLESRFLRAQASSIQLRIASTLTRWTLRSRAPSASAFAIATPIALRVLAVTASLNLLEGEPVQEPIKNDLGERLTKLNLTYRDVPRLCPSGMPLGIKTVRDLATGRRLGDRRSWERIRAALNTHLKSNAYDLEDLIGEKYNQYLRHWIGGSPGGAAP